MESKQTVANFEPRFLISRGCLLRFLTLEEHEWYRQLSKFGTVPSTVRILNGTVNAPNCEWYRHLSKFGTILEIIVRTIYK